MNNEKVSGKGDVRCVAKAAFLALVRGAIRLVLGDVFVELEEIFGCEATDRTLVDLEDVNLEFLQRLGNGTSW